MEKTRTERIRIVKAAVLSLLSAAAVWAQYEMSPADISLLAAAGISFLLIRSTDGKGEKRERLICSFSGIVFALLSVLGKLSAMVQHNAYYLWTAVRFLGLYIIFSRFTLLAVIRLKNVSLVVPAMQRDISPRRLRGVFFSSFAVIFACFFLWLLYEYPGGISPDSNNQLLQATGQLPYSDHHPIVHTMVIKLLFDAGVFLSGGSQTFGAALYHFFQTVFLAACFSYLVETLYRYRVRKWVIVVITLVFILLPYHGSYSVTMWKDVWFGAIVLVWCVTVFRLLSSSDSDGSAFEVILFALASLAMCLFRGNGLYAYASAVPFTVLVFRKRNRAVCILSIAMLAAAFIIKGPVYTASGILPTEAAEPYSIPIQQISRAVAEGAELTADEEKLISRQIPVELIPRLYDPTLSDPVKEYIKLKGDDEYLLSHKADYLRLWIGIGLRYPAAYLRAHIDQTLGYWYPDVVYWALGSGSTMSVGLEIEKAPVLPDSICRSITHILALLPTLPFAGLVFSIGTGTWVLIFTFILCMAYRKREYLLLFVPVFAVLGTLLLATPVFAEFRYAYSMFTALPLLGILPFYNRSE